MTKMPAYKPDAKPSEQFANPVHCVRLSNDGLVYVCDRANNRIQVFRKDGTFVKEFRVTPETLANGSVWDLVLSEDAGQKFIFMADGANGQIVTLNRRDRRSSHAMGPPRPPARPVQVGAQHRHRFQGQSLHRRGRVRPPRAEIQEDAMIRKSVAVAAISLMLVSGASAWNDILNSVWGPKGNDTGGIIPWSPENELMAFEIAQAQCGNYHKFAVATSITRGPGNYIAYKCVWDQPGTVIHRRERRIDVIIEK